MSGVSQGVAMQVTRHKTTSASRRYPIVDEKDRRDARAQIEDDQSERGPNVTAIRKAQTRRRST